MDSGRKRSMPAGNFVLEQPAGCEDIKFSRKKKFEAKSIYKQFRNLFCKGLTKFKRGRKVTE